MCVYYCSTCYNEVFGFELESKKYLPGIQMSESERENFIRNFPQRGLGEREIKTPNIRREERDIKTPSRELSSPDETRENLHFLFDDCYSTLQSSLSRGLT